MSTDTKRAKSPAAKSKADAKPMVREPTERESAAIKAAARSYLERVVSLMVV